MVHFGSLLCAVFFSYLPVYAANRLKISGRTSSIWFSRSIIEGVR